MIAPIRQDKRHHWVTKLSIGVGCPYRGFLFIPDVRYHQVQAHL